VSAAARVIEVMGWNPGVPGWDKPAVGWPDWRQSGACGDMNPDDLFADPGSPDEVRVLAACAACPVRRQCLAFAVEQGIADGIWGGMTEGDLRRLLGTARTASPLCTSGRHLLADVGVTADGRCRACKREDWRRRNPPSGLGMGRTAEPRERNTSGHFTRAEQSAAA
jgi:WhiB family redox-sensing transcriptional regulator